MTPDELIEIATRHQVFLERLKTSEAWDFIGAVDRIEGEVLKSLRSLDVDKLNELSLRELKSLVRSISDTSSEILAESTSKLSDRLLEIGEYEADFEKRAFESLDDRIQLKDIRKGAVATAASQTPVNAFGGLFMAEELNRWQKTEILEFANAVKRGYSDGLTVGQTIRSIKGTKAARFVDGVTAKAKRDAQTLVRTSIQHYSQVARAETWKRNEDVVIGWRFIATLDGRTTAECRGIESLGRIYKLGEGPTPPRHRRCRSTTVPELGPGYDFLDEGATRSALFGPVSADKTYYDWLKDQSPEFQDAAIGPTRSKLLRSGGLSAERFAKLSLNKNFEPLTLDQMKRLEPLAFKRAGLIKN